MLLFKNFWTFSKILTARRPAEVLEMLLFNRLGGQMEWVLEMLLFNPFAGRLGWVHEMLLFNRLAYWRRIRYSDTRWRPASPALAQTQPSPCHGCVCAVSCFRMALHEPLKNNF